MSGQEDVTLSIQVPRSLVQALDQFPAAGNLVRGWARLWYDNPAHLLVETALVLFILYILLKRPGKKASKLESLPPALVQELVDEFEPEPLVPEVTEREALVLEDYVVLEEQPGKYTRVRGQEGKVLNLATMDFLGLAQRPEIKKAASDALDKYGCGSCGPRGFYGSIDVHVYLEQDLAKFFGTEEAIVYSDASSAVSSAIPAFASRADLLVVDDGCNDAIMTGVNLSRSRVYFFKHNDMADLRRVLAKVDEEDKQLHRKAQRRFIVTEGLYRNYGDVVPLDEVQKLKTEFRWRLFLDESHALGVFGANGKGVHEHFGIPVTEIDLLVSSLSTALGSVGGFCVGSREVVEHQRLSGSGYCFSASSPPFVSTVASAAIGIMKEEARDQLMPDLKRNSQLAHGQVDKLARGFLVPVSNPNSALMHLRLDPSFRLAPSREAYDDATRIAEERLLRDICRRVRARGFLMVVANYISNPGAPKTVGSSPRPPLPPPSMRVSISAALERSEIESFVAALAEEAKAVLSTPSTSASAAPTSTLHKRK